MVFDLLISLVLLGRWIFRVAQNDKSRHGSLSEIRRKNRHSVPACRMAWKPSRKKQHYGIPVAGLVGQFHVHPSYICQIGESDQGRCCDCGMPSFLAVPNGGLRKNIGALIWMNLPLVSARFRLAGQVTSETSLSMVNSITPQLLGLSGFIMASVASFIKIRP